MYHRCHLLPAADLYGQKLLHSACYNIFKQKDSTSFAEGTEAMLALCESCDIASFILLPMKDFYTCSLV
jgi:hypothetical protein